MPPLHIHRAYQSGVQIAQAYAGLVSGGGIFIRSTSKGRILEQSRWFRHGFNGGVYPIPEHELEMPDLVIQTGPVRLHLDLQLEPQAGDANSSRQRSNNTLACDLCKPDGLSDDDDILSGPVSPSLSSPKSKQWLKSYAPAIATRLETFVPGLELSNTDVRFLMALCGFETAYLGGEKVSPWCNVFSDEEWGQNEYWYDLDVSLSSHPYKGKQLMIWCIEILEQRSWLSAWTGTGKRMGE